MADDRIVLEDLPATILPSLDHVVAAMKDGFTVRLTVAQLRTVMLGGASNLALALKDLSNTDGPRGKLGATLLAAGNYNNLLENGSWTAEPGATNAPEPTNYYTVRVETNDNGVWVTQYARSFGSDVATDSKLYKRDRTSGGVWSSWIRVRENEAELDARYRNLTSPLGLNNYLINGDMRISQRGSVFNTNVVTLDRWGINFGTGGAGSVTHNPLVADELPRSLLWTQTTGGTGAFIAQAIEDVRSLAGRRVCVSFSAALLSGTTTLTPRLAQTFGTGGSPSAQVTTTGTPITITGGRVFQFLTLPSIVGKTLGSNNDSNLRFDLLAANGTLFSLSLTDVQLEAAPAEMVAPTPFERIPLALQMRMCRRYYQIHDTPNIVAIGAASTAVMQGSFPLDGPMRSPPSVSLITAPTFTNCTSLTVTATSLSATYQVTITGAAGQYGITGAGLLGFNSELI